MHTDSLCSLQIIPRMRSIGFAFDCSGQCNIASAFQDYQCIDLLNELGIQQCNQAECSPRIYNLSACINVENGIIIRDTTTQTTRDGIINDMAMEQSQAGTPTTVYNAETTSRTEAQDVSCTTKPLSSTEVQVIIGVLAGLLVMLLVMAVIPWIWIYWKLKVNGGLNRDKQQAR